MSDRSLPRVRPVFLRWSLLLAILLLPFLVHSVWTYVEVRRLKNRMEAIRAKGEPASVAEIFPHRTLTGDAADADRYYRAAAALATHVPGEFQRNALHQALDRGERPPELIGRARGAVKDRSEGLLLLDRATELNFEGFQPGTSYSYRKAQLLDLARLAGMRALLQALDQDGDAAGRSLYAAARLHSIIEPFGDPPSPGWREFTSDLGFVVSGVRVPTSGLLALAGALADADNDRRLDQQLIRWRATLLDSAFPPPGMRGGVPWTPLVRPWALHRLTAQVDATTTAIGRPEEAWHPFGPRGLSAIRHTLALVRSARIVIAVERYRRSNDERLPARIEHLIPSYLQAAPVDPFSKKPLHLTIDASGYAAYSVADDGRDDGGREIGIRVRNR
jgi:hypothetical protein